MKKVIIILVCLFLFSGVKVFAEIYEFEPNANMENYWEKNGLAEQKVLSVASKIINANKLNKRIPIRVERKLSVINAYSSRMSKSVVIYSGLLQYIDNDDELASVLGHEMAHSLDSYDGPAKWLSMTFNSKQYEYKADLIGVDLMVKAGYNPIAAITLMNKWMGESPYDFGLFTSHPQTSKRLFNMYKYIYKKYPSALESDMIRNVNYQNFTYSAEKDITLFKQIEKEKSIRRESKNSL